MVRRVCLVSGGTGGHLMPAVALARELRERGHEPLLVTAGRDVERTMLGRELPGLSTRCLPGGERRPSRWLLPLWLGRATLACRRLLREEGVDCVVSTGGRASVPVGLAARSLGLPLYLLEQNAVTGRANRCLRPLAKRVYFGLPPAEGRLRDRALVTGTPLRRDVGRCAEHEARRRLGLPGEAEVVLVAGGSQGAQALNDVVPRALVEVARSCRHGRRGPLSVVHLTGAGREHGVEELYAADGGRLSALVLPGTADMAACYAAADLVVCRGGGTTVAELAVAGRPAVIVPYPHHRDRQQTRNAEVLAAVGGAVIVEERSLTASWLASIVAGLLNDPVRLRQMGEAAHSVARDDAAAVIAADLEGAVEEATS